jgi:hypothetical protein
VGLDEFLDVFHTLQQLFVLHLPLLFHVSNLHSELVEYGVSATLVVNGFLNLRHALDKIFGSADKGSTCVLFPGHFLN